MRWGSSGICVVCCLDGHLQKLARCFPPDEHMLLGQTSNAAVLLDLPIDEHKQPRQGMPRRL